MCQTSFRTWLVCLRTQSLRKRKHEIKQFLMTIFISDILLKTFLRHLKDPLWLKTRCMVSSQRNSRECELKKDKNNTAVRINFWKVDEGNEKTSLIINQDPGEDILSCQSSLERKEWQALKSGLTYCSFRTNFTIPFPSTLHHLL